MKPALRAGIMEEVDKLEKNGKDKEKGALWKSLKDCGGNVSRPTSDRVTAEAGEK